MPSPERQSDRSALPEIDVTHRERRAREALSSTDADALIVTSPTNVRWLTGFAGSNATVILRQSDLVLFTDRRYEHRAPVELSSHRSSARVEIASADLGDKVAAELGSTSAVALEADHVSWSLQRTIGSEWLAGHELIATSALLDTLRAVKDDAEVARIEFAARIVDGALREVRPKLGDRLTERQFAAALDAEIRASGADDIGFDTIVASGPNSAIPHHAPGGRTIEKGDLVIVDVGGRIDGYRSDMTRTFSVGPMTTEQARHFDTVIEAQQAGVDAMVVGADTSGVDAAARAVITDAGWGDAFTHGTGHGIGLDIHELPRVSSTATEVYAEGTVATVEPGVYLNGRGGVRIEDTCVATVDGARRLTRFPKDPEVI